jgi:hypothetical protein
MDKKEACFLLKRKVSVACFLLKRKGFVMKQCVFVEFLNT